MVKIQNTELQQKHIYYKKSVLLYFPFIFNSFKISFQSVIHVYGSNKKQKGIH